MKTKSFAIVSLLFLCIAWVAQAQQKVSTTVPAAIIAGE